MAAILQSRSLLVPEQRVVFDSITWDGYLKIHEAIGETRSSRLVYDCGILEISMPFEDHEFLVRMIERVILCFVFEMRGKLKTMGSTRLDYPYLGRGAEPDNAYYLGNQPRVKGRKVDLAQDPPPDLVIEVDISPSRVDKFALYAVMGIPEFWQFDGETLQFFVLDQGSYQAVDNSPNFPLLSKDRFYEFLVAAKEDEIQAEIDLRHWIQESIK